MAARGGRRGSASNTEPDRPVSPVSDSESNSNVFDDEYGTEYAESYQESIAESSHIVDDPFQDPSASNTELAENPFLPSDDARPSTFVQQRNSVRKSLQNQRRGSSGSLRRSDGLSQGPNSQLRRSMSVASTLSFAAPHSPSMSENGPSHPYAMYPQVMGMSRNPSIAASSLRHSLSSRSMRTRQGPSHPYNMYPQDVNPLEFDASANNQMHLGFPGHSQRFLRRRGPEGEEQDIVGIDGHAEQLPPYTRYPEDATTKTLAHSVPSGVATLQQISRPLPVALPSPTQSPTPRTPQPEGEALDTSPSNEALSTSSTVVNSSSQPSASSQSEKAWRDKSWENKTWKERAKTRICGCIPIWLILFMICVLAFIIVVCAIVITLVTHASESHVNKATTGTDHLPPGSSSNSASATSTYSYIDATPTTATPNMSPLPIGTFNVPLGTPDLAFGACLHGDQVSAWSCSLPAEQNICVNLDQVDGRSVFATCNNQSVIYGYGTQPPAIYSQTLRLVTDLNNETLGPAWHFQGFYDKLVIIPEALLTPPHQQGKRGLETTWTWPSLFATNIEARDKPPISGPVEVGDRPWFCAWDETFIEGFIYVSVANPATAPASNPTATLYSETNPITWSMASATYAPNAYEMEREAIERQGYFSPGVTYYRRDDGPIYSSQSAGGSSTNSPSPTPSPALTSSTSTLSPAPAPQTSSTPNVAQAPIPKLVKLEERRLEDLHPPAVCTLMQKMDDLTFVTVNDGNEQPITVLLNENDGPLSSNSKVRRMLERRSYGPSGGGAALQKRDSWYNMLSETCYCQWSSEQFD